jgi:uncharacterized protein (TIGR03086 family)
MHDLVAPAASPMRAVLRGITDDQLAAPTPCAEFDVRALLAHLLTWGPTLVGSAYGRSVPPAAGPALSAEGWRDGLERHLDAVVAGWSRPEAWQGTTRMVTLELPAATVGGMVVGELVVHGWDLARATDQWPVWPEAVLGALHEEIGRTAVQGREMHVYGPEVPVSAGAPTLDRLLGLTGRDPQWTTSSVLR